MICVLEVFQFEWSPKHTYVRLSDLNLLQVGFMSKNKNKTAKSKQAHLFIRTTSSPSQVSNSQHVRNYSFLFL